MRMVDIIRKKREGGSLTDQELRFFVKGYTEGSIPDYQAAALLMAICLNSMDDRETASLTMEMAASGDSLDLSAIKGCKVDKHSTGGVGDKTTLVVAPIVAACGVPVAKMSGRGLGHTGGTIDKLESIPGYRVDLSEQDFIEQVNRIDIGLIGSSKNLAPADKRIYALRDATSTVESLPLIASSIMSKKLCAGCDAILLDVKVGSGAFMKTLPEAQKLAETMVSIGRHAGKKTAALLTDMDAPLGYAVGNSLELQEAVEVLKGGGDPVLSSLCLELSAWMLFLADQGYLEQCRTMAQQALNRGAALQKFKRLIESQGGDPRFIDDPSLLPQALHQREIKAPRDGYFARIDAQSCGVAASILGAGRERKEDTIDYGAGIRFQRKVGDLLQKGDVIAVLYTNAPEKFKEAEEVFRGGLKIAKTPPQKRPMILGAAK